MKCSIYLVEHGVTLQHLQKNAATFLKDFCKGQTNTDPNGCEKCIFGDKKDGSCLIANEVPEDWRV